MAAGAAQQSKSARSNGSAPVTTAAAWIKRATHTVHCPTGAVVKMKIPDLAALMASEAVPENLRGAALLELAGGLANLERDTQGIPKVSNDVLKGEADLRYWLVEQAVIDPPLTNEQVRDIPSEDRDMIVAIAQRQQDVDALGIKIGLEPVSRYEKWRDAHACGDDCEACQNVVSAFSTQD